MRFLCVILISYCIIVVITMKENYGKFSLRLDDFRACKGPKRKDCCNISFEVSNNTVIYALELKQPAKITKGKIVANANSSDFIRLQMKNPCDHLFIRQLLQSTMNISRNCVMPPGNYALEFDIGKIAETYYGGMFLYGTFSFKSLFMTDDCNFSCNTVNVTFLPK